MDNKQIGIYVLIAVTMVVIVGFMALKIFSPTPPEKKEIVPVKNKEPRKKTDRKSRLAERRKSLRERHRQRRNQKPSSKGLVEVDAISEQIKRVELPKDKIDLMNQLWDIDDPALPKLVAELLNEKDAEVRLSAIELLDNKEKGEILACIEKALDDPDKDVRETAVVLLSDAKPSDKTKSLLVKSVDDSEENVRAAAFDVIGTQSVDVQEFVYNQSINSPYNDVKEMTVDLIMDIPSHRTVNLLFQGLNDTNEDFREYVNSKLDFIFSREFKNYNEAVAWWNKNKDKYDEELFEK